MIRGISYSFYAAVDFAKILAAVQKKLGCRSRSDLIVKLVTNEIKKGK